MKVHELKIWRSYFEAIIRGVKTFEIRKDDRHFAVGDFLDLHEYDPAADEYTGREASAYVSYVLRSNEHNGLAPDHVIMAIELRHVHK